MRYLAPASATGPFADRFWWCAPDKRPQPKPIVIDTDTIEGQRQLAAMVKPKLVTLPNGLKLPLKWYRPPTFPTGLPKLTKAQRVARDAANARLCG